MKSKVLVVAALEETLIQPFFNGKDHLNESIPIQHKNDEMEILSEIEQSEKEDGQMFQKKDLTNDSGSKDKLWAELLGY